MNLADNKVPLSKLQTHITDEIDYFICCASFEERSMSLAKAIGPEKIKKAIICINEDYASPAKKNILGLKEVFISNAEILSIHTNDPLLVADRFSEILNKASFLASRTIFVDITTFSHEELLILVRLLRNLPNHPKILAGYTGARDYAIGLSNEQKWLSRGVDDIRSVLGYPGSLVPSKKLHLIVLAGFESERAEKLIEAYDPAVISLGIGEPSASISQNHYNLNSFFHNKLLDFVQTTTTVISSVENFKFSCVDPSSTQRTVIKQVQKFPEYNVVVAPMNTKISTLGAAFAVFEEESIQLSYAHPSSYNTDNYSSAGDDCRLFDLTPKLASALPA